MGKPKVKFSDEEIASLYKQTLSSHAVAKQLGIGSTTVYRALARSGISCNGLDNYRRSAECYPREKQEEIRKLYESGISVPELQKQFGGSINSICEAIRRVGGTMRPPQGQRTKITPEQELEIVEQYKKGLSIAGIEAIFKCSHSIINRILHNYGLKKRKQRKLRKEGFAKAEGGYILVLVDESHPFFCMANKRRYIPEHRLVVAQKLGRPLLPHPLETVHHINGIHDDNRIENLELRQGQHGKGTIMCCLDCGSRNIGHTEIG